METQQNQSPAAQKKSTAERYLASKQSTSRFRSASEGDNPVHIPSNNIEIAEVSNSTQIDRAETWRDVVSKGNRRQQRQTVGTRNENRLLAGEQTAWLFVGRIHSTMTCSDIESFLQSNNINSIDCEEIPTRGRNKAFKVGVPFDALDNINHPDFWPKGVIVRRYIFRRQYHAGAVFRRQ